MTFIWDGLLTTRPDITLIGGSSLLLHLYTFSLEVFLFIMSFNMDKFAQNPNLEKLDRCTKADLFLIANMFPVPVPLLGCKVEIKHCLSDQLVDTGITAKTRTSVGKCSRRFEQGSGNRAAAAATSPKAFSRRRLSLQLFFYGLYVRD